MKHVSRRLSIRHLGLAMALATAAGCHNNDGKIGPESASVDVVVRDAPIDDLLSFRAELQSVRLRDDMEANTSNLLSEPATIDLLSLRDVFGWFSSERVPNGTYTSVVLDFTPFSYEAVSLLGFDVTVFPLGNRLVAPLFEPVEIDGSYRRFEVDVDLRDSLIGDVGLGIIGFRPRGTSVGQNGVTETLVDEIKGVVSVNDPLSQRLVIDAFVDGDMQVPLGDVEVRFDANTVFVQQSGNLYASAGSFVGSLLEGATQLEVHGKMIQRGVLVADRVEVEDRTGAGSTGLVELEGDVVTRFDERVFELRIRRIRKGAELFEAAVGRPTFVLVFMDVTTIVLLEDDDFGASAVAIASTEVLRAGQRVKVELSDISFEPFLAQNLVIRSPLAEFPSQLTRATGQSPLLEARIDIDSAVSLAGELSPLQPFTVDVANAELSLSVLGDPAISFRDLVPGLATTILGEQIGLPDAPEVDPQRVLVRAGSLTEAAVTAADRDASTFTAEGGTIVELFGDDLQPGPVDVSIEAGAVFLGDAQSEEELFDLFDGLTGGQELIVRVDGLSDRTASGVRGFEIEATVVEPGS